MPSWAEPSLCCQSCALSLAPEKISNPHRARCAVSDPHPAISCLGASRTPPLERVVKVLVTASEKPAPAPPSKHPKQLAVILSGRILTPSNTELSLCCQPCALSLAPEQASNPHRASSVVRDLHSAISCLGASRTPQVEHVVKVLITASEKPAPTRNLHQAPRREIPLYVRGGRKSAGPSLAKPLELASF